MALNHRAKTKQSGKTEQGRQIFTFFVEDMMFGLNVENVLMLGQDVNDIQRVPIEERGFSGVTKFQGAIVPVLDFAHRIGIPSGLDSKNTLLTILSEQENEHIEWLKLLENSLKSDLAFTKVTDFNHCAFTQWYKNVETRDETLQELLEGFDEPHEKLHALAEELITLRDNGRQAEALEILAKERATTFKRLRSLFARTREQVQSGMRQVLLFITLDGKAPRYALLIDEINDVLHYSPSDFQSSRSGGLALIQKIENVIEGIYVRENTTDCLFFDINKLTDIEAIMKKVS